MPDETDLPALAPGRPRSRQDGLDPAGAEDGRAASDRSSGSAASHPWMGRPLGAYDDEELRKILIALEEFAFGAPLEREAMMRPELLPAIAVLDRRLDRVRREIAAEEKRWGRPRTVRHLTFRAEESHHG